MIGFIFLLIFLIVLFAGLRGLGVLPRPGGVVTPGLTRADLHRLEEALTGLERRIDRLEDQQRFLEGLLEGRSTPRALPPGDSAPPSAGPERGVDSVLFDVDPDPKP